MPRFAIYARKSLFSGRGDSIESQVELCQTYLAARFPDSSASDIVVFEDEGFSGKNVDRPRFQQMLSHIRRGAVDYVVCYRLDRVSRNIKDFSDLVELLQEHNTSFVCIKEEFDTGTPMGRAMMYIASVFSQLERETIGERVKDNFYLLARTGRWLGGPRPTGFLPAPERLSGEGKAKIAYRLVPVDEELHTVKFVFATFLDTASLNGTVQRLTQAHMLTIGKKAFSIPALKSLLRNPVYATATPEVYRYFQQHGADLAFALADCDSVFGLMTYNRSTIEKQKKICKDPSDWIVSFGAHAGIIPGADWVRAQTLLEEKAQRYAGRAKKKHTALLSGLVRCGCGARMHVVLDGKPKKDGTRPMRYVCVQKDASKRAACDRPNVDAYAMDALVWNALAAYLLEESLLYEKVRTLRTALESQAKEARYARNTFERQAQTIGRTITDLVMTLADEDADQTLIASVKDRIATLQRQRAKIEELQSRQPEATPETNRPGIAAQLEWFHLLPDAASQQEKETLVRTLLDRVVWDGTYAHLFIRGERQG